VHRRAAAAALLGATVLALAGCTTPAGPGGTPSSAAPTAQASAPSVPRASPAASEPQVGLPTEPLPSGGASTSKSCDDRVLDARTIHLKGSRESVYWDLAVPEFSGAPSAAAINRHVRASAQEAIDRGLREGEDDAGNRRDVSGKATVTTSDRRTVQVELRWGDYLAGTAHPTDYVATTVVTTEEGRPVRLREVLADVPSGLRAIAKAIKPMARPSDPSGLAPKERNFSAWQTTSDGMRFTFGDYQLGGHGLRSYTVPWATMRPLLSAYGTGLLDPDIDMTTC
jgi:hypothetical protein